MKKFTVAGLLVLLGMNGCSIFGGSGPGGTLTPSDIQSKVQLVVQTGLAVASQTLGADKMAKVNTELQVVKATIKKDVIPIFDGTSTSVLTVQIADDALLKLKGQLPADVSLYITTGVGLLSTLVPMPNSPTASVPDATKQDILAAMNGIIGAIDAEAPATSGAPPTARLVGMKTFWAHAK